MPDCDLVPRWPHDMHDAEQEPSSICGLKGSRRYGQSQRELYEGRTGEGDYEARSGEAASYNRGNYDANFAGVPQGTPCPCFFELRPVDWLP